jgi:CopG family transcriptional regulator, nickel-responsive regulator
MERLTISMADSFAAELTAFMDENGYDNRSEAVRDLARIGLNQSRIDRGVAGECLATLSYVYDPHTRNLSSRLTETHHGHCEFQVATMHIHLDSDRCLEIAILRGDARKLKEISDAVIAERGVTHGRVSLIPSKSLETGRDVRPSRHAHSSG